MASLAFQIAKKIHFAQGVSTEGGDARRVSRPAVRIAIAGVAIGVAVMLLSVAVVVGFKREVSQKAVGFGGHLTVQSLDPSQTYEVKPICVDDSLLQLIEGIGGVERIRLDITRPAIIKTDSDFYSVIVKGVADEALQSGVALSAPIARKLGLTQGDRLRLFFIQQPENTLALGAQDASIRIRTLGVDSIFQTHLSEVDDHFILCSLDLLRQVSDWDEDMVSGVEVTLDDMGRLEEAKYALMEALDWKQDRRGTAYYVRTIEEQNPQLFSWLALLDTNVWVILILIAVVAAFTTISGLMIIILERTSMIGTLKALGMPDAQLRLVFLWVAFFVVGKGLLLGNMIGLFCCWIQWRWHVLRLDPDNYYLEWAPIYINLWQVLAVSLGTVVITLLVLLGPSALVAKINPVKAISSE